MRFSSILSLALPAITLAQSSATSTATTSSAAPTSTGDLEAICEAQAGPYTSYCPQCLYLCATSSVPDQCYYSVFFSINYEQSVCEQHGGYNCKGQAIADVCSGS